MLQKYEKLKAQNMPEKAIHTVLAKNASPEREEPLYNISAYTFQKLLDDPEQIAKNLLHFINGFSPKAREIFENFKFDQEVARLEKHNRLYLVVKEFANVDLHPEAVSNIEMGYVFEELIRRFNEQANEEAGDHFTPREVIRLMAHLLYTGDDEIYKEDIVRTIYDPACGTGGMLSVSEEYIKQHNDKAHLVLFGQEYNDEAYAICCSDLLIKDEDVSKIIYGDTLGDGESGDGHKDKTFHYMLANPPFGVEWKPEEDAVRKEYADLGFDGRFGPGLPRINDGSLLFLLHMISKMKPPPAEGLPAAAQAGGEGSKIAIVFNGSPLFTGDAGSGESNIRRWIIENDWLDAIVALPGQLFYNTGIYTYIWLVSNRKPEERRGKVQLIDATRHFKKMKKSLGNKRNELDDRHIAEITRLYGEFRHDQSCTVPVLPARNAQAGNGTLEERACSKIFDNREFGFLKVTVERPLRLNFQASAERINRLWQEKAFAALAESKKKKDKAAIEKETAAGQKLQAAIVTALKTMDASKLYKNRQEFAADLDAALNSPFTKGAGGLSVKLPANIKKAILSALSERDPTADICRDSKGDPEPDPDLRDTENISLPKNIPLPLPLDYDPKSKPTKLVELVRDHCEAYLQKEVLPHVEDAWIDYSKTKVGYEIPINRHFYVYQPPRPLEEIEADIKMLEQDILRMLKNV